MHFILMFLLFIITLNINVIRAQTTSTKTTKTTTTTKNPNSIRQRITEIMHDGYHLIQLNKVLDLKIKNQSSSAEQDSCIDPSPIERDRYYLEMAFFFRDVTGLLDFEPVKKIYSIYILNETETGQFEALMDSDGRTDCREDLEVFKQSDLKLCPSQHGFKIRSNIYPSIRSVVNCTCNKCLHLGDIKDDVIYKCQPVRRLEPALKRGECGINGVFIWKPALEYVSYACICSQDNARIEA